jgi:putative membrane protein
MRTITAPLSFLGACVLVNVALAQETAPDLDAWHNWHPHTHGFWWIFPVLMLVFFFLCMRRGRHGWWGPPWWRSHHSENWHKPDDGEDTNTQSALAILDRRFAQGEIDREEYEEKRSIISSSNK